MTYTDKRWLEEQYHGLGKSYSTIARQEKVALSTIQKWMRIHQLKARDQKDKGWMRTEGLQPEDLRRMYQQEDLSCEQIAGRYGVHGVTIHKWLVLCGIPRRKPGPRTGENNPRWKRGHTVNAGSGYAGIKIPGHPLASTWGYVKVHVLEMEKVVGRHLTKQERVHHKDGDKQNNRPDNLELFLSEKEHQEHERTLNRFAKQLLYGQLETTERTKLLELFAEFRKCAEQQDSTTRP
jgi:transposase